MEALENFVAPIPGKHPCGTDLRLGQTVELYRLDSLLKQDSPDWVQVAALAKQVLQAKSKDVAAALALGLAWTQQEQFEGLNHGLDLIRRLIEAFGRDQDQLFPSNVKARAKYFASFDGALSLAIRTLPLTDPEESFTWRQWSKRELLDDLQLRKGKDAKEALQQAIAEGHIDTQSWRSAINKSTKESLVERQTAARRAQDSVVGLNEALLAWDLPLCRKTVSALEDISTLLGEMVEAKVILEKPQPPTKPEPVKKRDTPQTSVKDDASVSGEKGVRFSDRKDALECLAQVRNYLQETERHNPAIGLLDRALEWADLPLEKWLEQVIENEDVLKHIRLALANQSDEAPPEQEGQADQQ